MNMAFSLTSPLPTATLHTVTLALKPRSSFRSQLTLFPKRTPSFFVSRSTENGAGTVSSSAATEVEQENGKLEKKEVEEEEKQELLGSNGTATAAAAAAAVKAEAPPKFKDPRWIGGTWDLKQFQKNRKTDWDAVIDAEARRRKWFEDNPEASSNDELVIFDTSIIPWWSWIKRFHLPEAELLNGRAAMIGFFMAYVVDGLTGVGLVDQMGNFFCKTLLLVVVIGVLLIRKNEDIDNLKKLLEETTFYDKQWQATYQDESSSSDLTKKE